MKLAVHTGALRRIRRASALLIVSTVTIGGCVAASVATAQVAQAAKGGGVVTDLVIDRLASLAVMNFFGLGAVALATFNATRKRVQLISAEIVNAKTGQLQANVDRVERLVLELSEHIAKSGEQRAENGKLMERILLHMTEVEKRHLVEDVISANGGEAHAERRKVPHHD